MEQTKDSRYKSRIAENERLREIIATVRELLNNDPANRRYVYYVSSARDLLNREAPDAEAV